MSRLPPPSRSDVSSESPRQPPASYPGTALGPVNQLHATHHATTLPSVASLANYANTTLAGASSIGSGSPQSHRSLGMQNILNPTADFEPITQVQRISHSPRRSLSATVGSFPAPLISPRSRKRREGTSPSRLLPGSTETPPLRRMLTPKSPAMRNVSHGIRNSPSIGSLRAVASGTGEGRVYVAEPGGSPSARVPPMPAMAMATHALQHPGGQSHDAVFISATGATSYATSIASQSVNTQGYVASPNSSSNIAEREPVSPYRATQYELGAVTPAGLHPSGQNPGLRSSHRTYGPTQPAYQMELPTDAGAMIVPVEVDTLQASKLADEKRKRNAGASARFRQRRKEKENAASQNIAELQKSLRDITEERDYYLAERNYLRDLLARTPNVNMGIRPLSPLSQRTEMSEQFNVLHPESVAPPQYDRHETGMEPSPARRRRTGDYQQTFATGHMSTGSYASTYPAPTSPYTLPPPPPSMPLSGPGLPDPRGPMTMVHPPLHRSVPPRTTSTVRQPPYDPFRRDSNPPQ